MANRVKLKFKQADGTFVEYRLDMTIDDILNSTRDKSLTEILTEYSKTDHTHKYAGSSSEGGSASSADKVNNELTIQINGGAVEDVSLFTFDGSVSKTINLTPEIIGAAPAQHGNHVPEVENVDEARFLRNDNTWQTITPSAIGAMSTPVLVNKTLLDNTLNLSLDRYQYVDNMTNGAQIVLPEVNTFTEIHLFFNANADLALILPNVAYQKIPEVVAGNVYEFIFTYVGNMWVCGYIEYIGDLNLNA